MHPHTLDALGSPDNQTALAVGAVSDADMRSHGSMRNMIGSWQRTDVP